MLDKQDRRIRRTKKGLREALLKLLETKQISQITTTELCKEADINRNTFYSHYTTPEELLNEIEEELILEIKTILILNKDDHVTYQLFNYFESHKYVCKVLFNNTSSKLNQTIWNLCRDNNIHHWQDASLDPSMDTNIYFQFASAGAMKLVQNWLNEDCKTPAKEICKTIDTLSLYGLHGYMKSKS